VRYKNPYMQTRPIANDTEQVNGAGGVGFLSQVK
jgi:hypothetical protein